MARVHWHTQSRRAGRRRDHMRPPHSRWGKKALEALKKMIGSNTEPGALGILFLQAPMVPESYNGQAYPLTCSVKYQCWNASIHINSLQAVCVSMSCPIVFLLEKNLRFAVPNGDSQKSKIQWFIRRVTAQSGSVPLKKPKNSARCHCTARASKPRKDGLKSRDGPLLR